MKVEVVTAATIFPVTRTEAKAHLRVDGTAEDDYLDDLIEAATMHVEEYCGRSFSTQTLRLHLDALDGQIALPRGPVTSVSSITYYDADNTLQTVSTGVYEADLYAEPALVMPKTGQSWPETFQRVNAAAVNYSVGGSAAPHSVKMAIKLLVGQWFEQRAAAVEKTTYEIPNGIAALLANHRSFAF